MATPGRAACGRRRRCTTLHDASMSKCRRRDMPPTLEEQRDGSDAGCAPNAANARAQKSTQTAVSYTDFVT
jgi:hypothetical protein